MTPHEFYLDTNGKQIDYDGAYGNQCVDLFKYFIAKQYGFNCGSLCPQTGYAKDIWNCFDRLTRITQYFVKIPVGQPLQDGDWVVWTDNCKASKNSHIAMFRLDNGNGTGIFLTQAKGYKINQHNFVYEGMLGALRPKIYIQEVQPIIETPKEKTKPIETPIIDTSPEPILKPVESDLPKDTQTPVLVPNIDEDKPVQVTKPKLSKLKTILDLVKQFLENILIIFKGGK
jgi:hypothetical protein